MVQDIIVYSLVLLALANAVYQLIRSLTRKNDAACGSCPNCGVKTTTKANYPKHLRITN